jgi:hypothetical protein
MTKVEIEKLSDLLSGMGAPGVRLRPLPRLQSRFDPGRERYSRRSYPFIGYLWDSSLCLSRAILGFGPTGFWSRAGSCAPPTCWAPGMPSSTANEASV